MEAASEAESTNELEAMCKEDSSWHPCQVSLSSTEDSLIVEFWSQELEDMTLNRDEALSHLRFRSAPLQGDDCSHIEGKHVLATNKSQFKSRFYEAKVEKVVRVRHSARVYCRCTFMIKWLHQDLKGQTATVPSSSIMKLASKSVNAHPTFAALLKPVKQMGLHSASPFPVMLEDFDVELDLNKLLEKQIEEINISANGLRNKITVDILEGFKAENKGHTPHEPVAASKVNSSHAQVSRDQDELKSIAQSSGELEVNIEDEGPQDPFSAIQEEHSECRSHLSPLAARAALALLVSSTHKHIAISGTELFNSYDGDNMSINKLSSEATKADKNGNKTADARKTFSAVQKDFGIQNSDSNVKISAKEIELSASTNTRRLTRSAVHKEKDKSAMKINQGLDESKSAHITGLYSSEGNATTNESNVLKNKNVASKKKKAVSSPLHAESNIPTEESNKKLISGDAGAIQDICVPIKTCAKETKSTVSTNMRRLTRSTRSSEENSVVPEDRGMEKKSGSRSSPSCDMDNDMPGGESNKKKLSGAVTRLGNIRQNEGSGDKSQGQKRKSTSSSGQELRFSPRLRFLPRTRAQNRS